MAAPLPRGTPTGAPPLPPRAATPAARPSFEEYKANLEANCVQKHGFYIDVTNKVAIKLIEVDGKYSQVRIPLKKTDDEYLQSKLTAFNDRICTDMVRLARNIGLGRESTPDKKSVSAVKIMINKETGEMSTQKIYTNRTEGSLRNESHYKTKAAKHSQKNPNEFSNILQYNQIHLRYKDAATLLNTLGKHFFRPSMPLPEQRNPPAPATQERRNAPEPATQERRNAPAPSAQERRTPPPAPAAQERRNAPAPAAQQPVNRNRPPQPIYEESGLSLAQSQFGDLRVNARHLGEKMPLKGKIGKSEYTYEDLKKALIAYDNPAGIDAKIKIGKKDVPILDIFNAAYNNRPQKPNETENRIFEFIHHLVLFGGGPNRA